MKLKVLNRAFLIGFILLIAPVLYAQNGESLFKAKCNTCHTIEKNSTGPKLKGVIEKWSAAGEKEMLYDWVKSSGNLIASGKSSLAKEAQGFSPTVMPNQPVTNEEIDAIFEYVETFVPAAPKAEGTIGGEVVVEIVPNYHNNLIVFYGLIALMVVLLFAIYLIAKTMSIYIRSDYYKNKLMERISNDQTQKIVLLIAFVSGIVGTSNGWALSFDATATATAGNPWVLVEKSDLIILMTINLVLLGVLLYLRNMLRQFQQMILPKKEIQLVAEKASTLKKWNAVLTDAVPIEKETAIVMEHEYDGIRELDNNLPPWWVVMFFATILFSVVYVFHYHILKTGDLQIAEYTKEVKKADVEVQNYLSKMAMNVDETSATLMTESSDLSAGKAIFTANCITCHKPNGEGDIGPNLTDDYWIHGGDIKSVFKTIKIGTANGMPEHASKLNPIQIQQVSSYVLSLPYVKGKEPEGEKLNQ